METPGSSSQAVSLRSACVPGVPQFGYWLQRTGRASSVGHVILRVRIRAWFRRRTPSRVAEECDGETMRPLSVSRVDLTGEESSLVEDDAFVPEVIDGATELGGECGERFGFAVLLLVAAHPDFGSFGVTDQEAGGFAKGPLEMGVADLLAGRSLLLSGGFV